MNIQLLPMEVMAGLYICGLRLKTWAFRYSNGKYSLGDRLTAIVETHEPSSTPRGIKDLQATFKVWSLQRKQSQGIDLRPSFKDLNLQVTPEESKDDRSWAFRGSNHKGSIYCFRLKTWTFKYPQRNQKMIDLQATFKDLSLQRK